MRRLVLACLVSLLGYALAFGFMLDRPLTHGYLQHQIDAKLARAALLPSPKLVILAGSNGPYSHRCEIIEPRLVMPCVNGGVAVGIGLDYLFARWRDVLHAGDIVYLPMEQAQYVRSRAATEAGPDAAIMFRHDWRTLGELPPGRWLAAAFAFDVRAGLMSLVETALQATSFRDPRVEITGTTNAWGDHVGHTLALAAANRAVLASFKPYPLAAALIRNGEGAASIASFTRWATAHDVRVVGGLPTEFADAAMSDASLEAIRAIYLGNGGSLLELPNRSRYPRSAFFDTAEHLSEPWQIVHSAAVADGLAHLLDRE